MLREVLVHLEHGHLVLAKNLPELVVGQDLSAVLRVTHTVLVRENGFEYDGQRYRSLTVIAEKITGAHWSGPRFFGVSKRSRVS
jgi:hypothetical protein